MNDKLLDRNCVLLDGACKCRRGHLYEDCKYAKADEDKEQKIKKEMNNECD